MSFSPLSSFQVNFNEPLSMLQRLTEDLEYHELLDKAARCDSSLEQMCLVAAFSVSSYSTTVHRTAKPFNPLLGETYELDRLEEFGYRSLCEQVMAQLQRHFVCMLPDVHAQLFNTHTHTWRYTRLNRDFVFLCPLRWAITHLQLHIMWFPKEAGPYGRKSPSPASSVANTSP